ncbi:MAG: hypothetical protein IPN76_32475 [Saprospiraceae bacterium]|nr:hypothetical protein [Saprospiraceae bacterium]
MKFIYSAYQIDGKYYLSGCSHWFGELEREIKQGDSFTGFPDHHCHTTYTVEKLDGDSIYLSYKIECRMFNEVFITKGDFSIFCQKERALAPEVLFEGEKIDSFLAKKHIAEGRIYLLAAVAMKDLGNFFDSDSCRVMVEKKYGVKEYPIKGCLPLEDKQLLLTQYNNAVFDFLKMHKACPYPSDYELTSYLRNEVETCRHEKAKRDRALKAPPSGR